MSDRLDPLMQDTARSLESTVPYRPVSEILAGGDHLRRRARTRRALTATALTAIAATAFAWTSLEPPSHTTTVGPATPAPTAPATSRPATSPASTTAPTSSAPASTAPTSSTSPVPHWPTSAHITGYAPENGTTVGVGQPVSVNLQTTPTPDERAAIERALTVRTTPHVDGAWSWITSTRLDWRPEHLWQPGTTVTVDGGPVVSFTFTVGRSVISTVDVSTHLMTVKENGKLLRTIDITAGSQDHFTWGGVLVALSKTPTLSPNPATLPPGATPSHWAVALADSGVFLSSATWPQPQLGKANTTLGSIAMSEADAKFMYDLTEIGDVVNVVNAPSTINPGNGFSDWNVRWTEWLATSATGVQKGQ